MHTELIALLESSLIFGISAGLFAILLAPLQFLKVVRQEVNAHYWAIAKDYYTKQGIGVFFRGYRPYAAMQFISSAVFGLSNYVSDAIFASIAAHAAVEVLARSTLGALFETTATVRSEMTEIVRNKQEFIKAPARATEILAAIFCRNTIFWIGGVAAYKLAVIYKLSFMQNTLLGLVFGVVTGIISIPLDAIATRNCGADISMSLTERLKLSYARGGLNMVFSGTVMRIIQIAVYTAATTAIMLMLNIQ